MRCTRCDRIAVPQLLGRTPDGRLVFGWCAHCLAEESCSPVEIAQNAEFVLNPQRTLRQRLRRLLRIWSRSRQWHSAAGRRLLLLLLAVMMTLWALTLTLVGAFRITWPATPSRSVGLGSMAFLVSGAIMALVALVLWGSLIPKRRRLPLSRPLVRLVATIALVVSLAAIFLWPSRYRDFILFCAGLSALIGWWASRFPGSGIGRSNRPTTSTAT